ncbi:MAG: Ig-like domain-containing protein [Prosthecobacter sp.]
MNKTGQIVVTGTDLRVFRGDAESPLFGRVTRDGDSVRFAPALPFVAGESYRVEVRSAAGAWGTQKLLVPRPEIEVPVITLAPSPAVLPANALKLYLQFSQPMEQGVFLERITLHRQDESIVEGPFRETELWSPDGKRLTLWLHPGRQKTGVNLNTDEGPVLVPGQHYTLRIAASWRSAAGVPLGKPHNFPLEAAAPDHTCPEPKCWQLTAPKPGTRDPVHLLFDERLDPALLSSALHVERGGEPVAGTVHVPPDTRSWAFTPEQPWSRSRHAIFIDPLLEDLAGNNLQHPFEVDRDQPPPPAVPGPVTLPFEVR